MFVREVFSESGSGSWARLGSAVALAFSCVWVSAIVYWTHALPALDGLTVFIGTLYGLGKAGQVVSSFKSNGNGNPPLPPNG